MTLTLTQQRAEVRKLNAKQRRLQGKPTIQEQVYEGKRAPAPRLTVSEVARTLLNRTPREMSHVGLSRNSRGDTQIEVVVYVGEDAEASTVEAASTRCQTLYDDLVTLYPMVER